jgi:hypothetical protein
VGQGNKICSVTERPVGAPLLNGLNHLAVSRALTCGHLAVKKTGTLQSLNVSPKGFFEGFLLKCGTDVVQINLPKDHLHNLGEGWSADSQLSVEVEADEPWVGMIT